MSHRKVGVPTPSITTHSMVAISLDCHHRSLSRHLSSQRRATSLASLRSSSEHVGPAGQQLRRCSSVCVGSPQTHCTPSANPQRTRLAPVLATFDLALLRATQSLRGRFVPAGSLSLGSGRALLCRLDRTVYFASL